MDQGTDFEQERKRLTARAWWVTGGYCGVLLLLASFVAFGDKGLDTFRFMTPNEVGDLLAGTAGPLAFIWLVYGYFLQGIAIRQQAEELRQNTKALELQAEELKNSVEQQRELVGVSKRQFESHLESVRQEQERQRAANQPNFVFHVESRRPTYDLRGYETSIEVAEMGLENIGATVTNVEFSTGASLRLEDLRDMTTFESGRKVRLRWKYERDFSPEGMWMAIDFTDSSGLRYKRVFDIRPGGEDGLFNGIVVQPRASVTETS